MMPVRAAAFGRLCVETKVALSAVYDELKQPPSGGCVLKLLITLPLNLGNKQPPSGGCVLKPPAWGATAAMMAAAAFGRLCVETV